MPPPITPADSQRYALRGRLVTMDPQDTVLPDGVLYVHSGLIEDLRPASDPPPPGYEGLAPTASGGTVYPGLIELHNHLPYDVLQLWQVPKRYTNRAQWSGTDDYRRLVTGPMTVLGHDPLLMPAVVRYVEAKALVNGTTTSQGIALFSNAGARRMYRGVVRNVEQPQDPALPAAASRIADVDAADARHFLDRISRSQRLLLHLAEGVSTDLGARAHFQALEFEPGQWAITENLIGIHCTALTAADFDVLGRHGGAMVWSPLSNLLLYGQTTDIAAARRAGVRSGLGSDWSVSGSKGLLGELKAARLASALAGDVYSDRELVAMATRDAAGLLRWGGALGTLQAGKRADLLAVSTPDGAAGDPYGRLIDARADDITLVVIDGTARYGTAGLMRALCPGARLEDPGATAPAGRLVNLDDGQSDPLVAGLSLAEATGRLAAALGDLPARAAPGPPRPALALPGEEPTWHLALDEIQQTGVELRPRLPVPGMARAVATGPPVGALAAEPRELTALALDALTAGRDPAFLATLVTEANLPKGLGADLAALLAGPTRPGSQSRK